MTVTIIRGDARHLPLPDASVDLIVTSPPYWALRDYRDGDESLAGQIGNEPCPREYIAALIDCTAEWARVLKPSGSIFVNLGDKYAGGGQGGNVGGNLDNPNNRVHATAARRVPRGARAKSLLLLPERYRIGAVDQLDLIARAVIVWDKPNGLPESVTDRVRRAHEDWVHLTKEPRYFSAVDEIRAPVSDYARRPGARRSTPPGQRRRAMADTVNPLGALPGSVWEIPTEPLRVPEHLGADHYAAFPTAWPRRIITGWSPSGICTACGEGRRPVCERKPMEWRESPTIAGRTGDRSYKPASGTMLAPAETRITGYSCACPEPTADVRPAVVLDPFGGTGTTALVASVLGRRGVSIDRSADYCRIAAWRTTDPGERARGLEQPKPKPVPDAQPPLFDDEVTA
jgi:DNA modification methylase